MLRKKFSIVAAFALVLLVGSCVDDDYDLSDIDSTVELNVTDLVLPVNIDSITLATIFDLSDDSRVKNVGGVYALVEDGTFSSSPINVPSYTATLGEIAPIVADMTVNISSVYNAGSRAAARSASGGTLVFSCDIPGDSTYVDAVAYDLDESIVEITRIGVEETGMRLTVSIAGLENVVDEVAVEDMAIQFIPGLEATISAGSYDMSTGIITIDDVTTTGNKIDIEIAATGLTEASGMTLDEDRTFSVHQCCYVASGCIAAYSSNLLSGFFNTDGSINAEYLLNNVPQSATFTCAIDIDDIVASEFSGKVKYDIDGIDIDPVEMNDIPSVLNQLGTDIKLGNPQIYLQLNNPVYSYGIYATAGLDLASSTSGVVADHTLDSDIIIDEADNKYCLSPTDPGTYYSGTVEKDGEDVAVDFSGSEHCTFSTLGSVLSGEKMPDYVSIYVTDPNIPEQTVEKFKLGTDIDAVEGVYVFYAPLQLTSDSKIVYTDTVDGWNDEDVDAITVTKLVVDADLTTDIPIELDIKAYPISVGGGKIYDSSGNAVVGTVNTTVTYGIDEAIEITISGTVTHLDGIIVEAEASGTDETDDPLSPTETITLKNVKATVSGSYVKEL